MRMYHCRSVNDSTFDESAQACSWAILTRGGGMDRDRPGLLSLLHEAIALEPKFQPLLELPISAEDEITAGVRDGAAHVLRCLKVWYDLPSDVLFVAINLMDRFLTRMKARDRHMACISLSCFLLASKIVPGVSPPDAEDAIAISQCKCSLGDLQRMQAIILNKLESEPNTAPVTPLNFIRLLQSMWDLSMHPDLMLQLEIVACDATCVNFRPSEVALVLLQPTTDVLDELQSALGVPTDRLHECAEAVQAVLARYHAHAQVQHRQRLVWRVSQRTMRLLRPTDRLVRRLPTIDEQHVDSWSDDRPPTTFHCELE